MKPAHKKPSFFGFTVLVVATLGYLLSFPFLNSTMGPASTALSMIPAGLAGYLFGMWPGIIYGFLTFPLNVFVLNWVGSPGLEFMIPEGLPGTVAIILIAGLMGKVRDLGHKIKKENALRRQLEKQFKMVTDRAPVVLFALDTKGIFTFSEGKGLEKLGLKPGEVVGRDVLEVYKNAPEVLEGIKRALAGEEFNSVVNVNGLVFDSWYSNLKDETGKISGVVGMATDMTEHKKVRDNLVEQTREAEKLNELTVDRELKMSEMKDVLKKTQEELDNLKKSKLLKGK